MTGAIEVMFYGGPNHLKRTFIPEGYDSWEVHKGSSINHWRYQAEDEYPVRVDPYRTVIYTIHRLPPIFWFKSQPQWVGYIGRLQQKRMVISNFEIRRLLGGCDLDQAYLLNRLTDRLHTQVRAADRVPLIGTLTTDSIPGDSQKELAVWTAEAHGALTNVCIHGHHPPITLCCDERCRACTSAFPTWNW